MGNGFTSFVDDVEGTVYDVVELESIIGFREALYVQRIVLSKLWKYEILFCTFWGVYGKREISVGEGCTWWPTTATQTIMALREREREREPLSSVLLLFCHNRSIK